MESTKIAIGPQSAPAWLADAVVQAGVELADPGSSDGLVWYSARAEGLAELLGSAPQIRWVQLATAGVEAFRELIDDARTWTCAKGVYAEAVAEHALAMILSGMRGIATYARAEAWTEPSGRNLHGANVTIVGGGGIAVALLRMLAPFSTVNTVVRRRPAAMPTGPRVVSPSDFSQALSSADVVVLALPLTDTTVAMMGAEEFRTMRPDALLVNVARGAHVDTGALVEALDRGEIGGAALDVTDPEPLPPGHPLWRHPNCLITPHTANTPAMMRAELAVFLRANVAAFATGQPLHGVVDPHLLY